MTNPRSNVWKLPLMTAALALSLGACGDDGGVTPGVDAPPAADAPPVAEAQWTALTEGGAIQNPAFYVYNGEYYAVIGALGGEVTICKWNPATAAWESQTGAPNAAIEPEFIIDGDGMIVAKVANSICRYNPATGVWDPIAPAPAGSTMLAAFDYTADNEIMAIIDGDLQQWDGNAWTPMTTGGAIENPAFYVYNGEYYAVIGPLGGEVTICKWNPATSAWESQTGAPNAAIRPEFIVNGDGILAVVAESICRYNPETGVWDPVAPAPAGSAMLAVFDYTADDNIMGVIDGNVSAWAVP